MSKALSRTVVVRNPQGLHARPADMLVRMANQFTSNILISRGGEAVDCKSILSLLTLGAACGTELSLRVEGDDAKTAIDSIEQLFLRGFDELGDEDAADNDSCSEETGNMGQTDSTPSA
ncbi:HPr family phosphocarrier protein [Stieleria sp. JC731]|uniref:HPr family phosphocarrier protein n=1 Tax=Pirellulaceae TaxID=2691357 RepID=UPI001E4B46CD|nr:HPr family phosphocarrier protein [Stieleria sp. JC731]MCC9598980.1 HPr family phosphocarrier protein [Stieleria sp. JC731]